MYSAGSRAFGCLFLLSFPIAIAAAAVIALGHMSRGSVITCALAGVVSLFCLAGYIVAKAIGVARRPAATAGPAGPRMPAARPDGKCSVCRIQPAYSICARHGLWLCPECARTHHEEGICFYTGLYRQPYPNQVKP